MLYSVVLLAAFILACPLASDNLILRDNKLVLNKLLTKNYSFQMQIILG